MENKDYMKKYRSTHRELVNKRNNEYRKTKKGRAISLISHYKFEDNKYNRGECTLTNEQLIQLWENGCYWCRETDWTKLGADRLDNSKPHTIDNCVCSCKKCNNERQTSSMKKVIQAYTLDGNLFGEYNGVREAARELKVSSCGNITDALKGRLKTAYSLIWRYKETAA